jgi:hypothetical protein
LRLLLADIRDAITTAVRTRRSRMTTSLRSSAQLTAEKQGLRKVAELDDKELDRAVFRALRQHALH